MTWLLESPLPTIVLAVLVETALVAALVITGRREVLWAIAGVVALTAGVLLLERAVVTDRETIEELFGRATRAIAAHDTNAVVAMVDPQSRDLQATVRRVLTQVPMKQVEITHLTIEFAPATAIDQTATADLVAIVSLDNSKGNLVHDRAVQPARIRLRKQGGQWLVTSAEARDLHVRGGS
ncbi:MAG TPA: hypothetical protein VG713_00470 [Pirellulales bacterium]|nr:hypothetical protein [Pirellulales bacterium]